MSITIRPWEREDLPSIRWLLWNSWIAAYSTFVPEVDLRIYFDTHYTEASVLNMFHDPLVHGLVAVAEDGIAGFAKLFFNRDENRLYVSSLYLLPQFQGQAIGAMLLEEAERHALGKGLEDLWIGVMVQNTQALRFYRKAGFVFVREEPFTMGSTTVVHLIGYLKLAGESLLRQKTVALYGGEMTDNPSVSSGPSPETKTAKGEGLAGLCLRLLAEQKKTWRELHEGCETLATIREREVSCRESAVRLQYNSGRMKSTTAAVNPENGKERRCFLCLDRLPGPQKGILYRGEYLILCNPMPIFSPHFTIAHVDHRRQAIGDHLSSFLHLIADLGPGWTVYYNGPRCGASAPDHLHFQAGPSGQMPIEKELREEKRLTPVVKVRGVQLYRVRKLGREVVMLEGNHPSELEQAFKTFMKALQKVQLAEEEPMLNAAGLYSERSGWRVVIFPRRKHRPDAFYEEGSSRRIISPGAIDMAGLVITPVERDFEQLDAPAIEGIYNEVSLGGEVIEKAIEATKEME